MKVNELRIGSLVNYEQTTHLVTSIDDLGVITSVWVDDKNKDKDKYTCKIEEIKPIPITEKWVLKLGFLNTRVIFDKYTKSNIGLVDMGKYWVVFYEEKYGNSESLAKLKYVHQIQNLYFSLTGEELKLNEK